MILHTTHFTILTTYDATQCTVITIYDATHYKLITTYMMLKKTHYQLRNWFDMKAN